MVILSRIYAPFGEFAFEFLNRFKHNSGFPNSPIIAISSRLLKKGRLETFSFMNVSAILASVRGQDTSQDSLFSYGSLETRIRETHPLRPIRKLVDEVLRRLSPHFAGLYAAVGRPSIAPEKQLRALLIMVLYSVRSELRLMEELEHNLLYRWFVGLGMDEPAWHATVFSKNRERFIDGEVARLFFDEVLGLAKQQDLVSEEHFSVDGTLIEAWASLKSFQPKQTTTQHPPDDPGNPTVNFHGQRRSNETHESTTDPDARLARKGDGKEAKLCYVGNVMIENRHGIVVDTELLQANGTAERDAALLMAERIPGDERVTVAGDKGYDTRDFVAELRQMNVTPHVAQNINRPGGSAIDRRTTRHAGYAISQQRRKIVEEFFGWLKTVAGQRKTKYRGLWRVGWAFTFAAAAYNLVRMRNLAQLPVQPANA
jgi:transposase